MELIMTEEEKKTTMREGLKRLLQENVLVVSFIKADGTKREMRCTLDPNLLPELPESKTEKPKRAVSREVLPVYDLDKQGWRSFRLDSVENFKLG